MGIHHFFGWYRKNFKIKSYNTQARNENNSFKNLGYEVDCLLLDINGIVHDSFNKVMENWRTFNFIRKKFADKNEESKKLSSQIYNKTCISIKEIIDDVRPKKKVIICLDGPAPVAKQIQQRQRRFKSSLEKNDGDFFSRSNISPGTIFLKNFSVYFNDWLVNVLNYSFEKGGYYSELEFIFSSELVQGEGEHKLFDYVRKNKEMNYCINSADADIIMLSMLCGANNMYILRRDHFRKDINNVLDINSFKDSLYKKIDIENLSEKRFIRDFVFMCFFLGNDFLPSVPGVEIVQNGIELMLDIYKKTYEEYGYLTVYSKKQHSINRKSFCYFLGKIDEHVKESCERHLLNKDVLENDLMESCCTEKKGELDMELYREKYYQENLNVKTNEEIADVCRDYFTGLTWVLNYYTTGKKDWLWFYQHYYSPFIFDMKLNINELKKVNECINYENNRSLDPFMQLLCVLPPSEKKLLPRCLRELMENSDISKYYVKEFKIDYRLKKYDWQGIPILPVLNVDEVKKEYKKHIRQLTEIEKHRNMLQQSRKYLIQKNRSYEFKSKIFPLKKCHVYTSKIDL